MRKEALFAIGSFLGVAALSTFAFSRETKWQVRSEQDFACDDCGTKPRKLEIHHIVPQRNGGSDERINAVGLCPNCHDEWDEQSKSGVIYPGKPITEAVEEQFKSKIKKEEVIYQYPLFVKTG